MLPLAKKVLSTYRSRIISRKSKMHTSSSQSISAIFEERKEMKEHMILGFAQDQMESTKL
jgi:hypothetical protein